MPFLKSVLTKNVKSLNTLPWGLDIWFTALIDQWWLRWLGNMSNVCKEWTDCCMAYKDSGGLWTTSYIPSNREDSWRPPLQNTTGTLVILPICPWGFKISWCDGSKQSYHWNGNTHYGFKVWPKFSWDLRNENISFLKLSFNFNESLGAGHRQCQHCLTQELNKFRQIHYKFSSSLGSRSVQST